MKIAATHAHRRNLLQPLRFGFPLIMCLLGGFTLCAQNALAYGPRFSPVNYQQPTAQKLTLKAKNERLLSVLQRLEKQMRYVFVYSSDDVNTNQRISLDVKDADVTEVVQEVAKQAGVSYEIINDKIILRTKPVTGNNPGTGSEAPRNIATVKNVFDFVITGRITDEAGYPIAGASVVVKGTSVGTTTNTNGEFSLNVPDDRANGSLVISFVGYASNEVPLAGRREFTAALKALAGSLEDVVVVGYGTQRRASVTGAVDKVGSAAIAGRPVTNLSTALQGTSPNLIIQQRNFEPGQPVNINIRGLGTLGNNSPLVVIDGIIGGDINLINPADIESVSILKDAGAAAIYGSRSANGVLLITTKKGRKNEKPSITYNGIYGIQSPRVTYTPVDAWENAYYKNESLANSGQSPAFTPMEIRTFQERGNGDWRPSNILQDAVQQNHNLSISGGSANSTYLISGGYLNQQSNFIGPDYGYQRYNLRLNQSTEVGRFKFNTILSYVKAQNKDHSTGSDVLIVDAGRVPLYYSFQDSAGNFLTNPVSAQFNPKGILEEGGFRRSNDDEVFGNFNGELTIAKGLKLRGVFGGTIRSNTQFGRRLQVNFQPGGVYGQDRQVFDANSKSLLTNTQLLAEYNRSFGAHGIQVLAGATNESFKTESSRTTLILSDPGLGTPTTGSQLDPNQSFNSNGTNPFNGQPATVESSINSIIGRLSYNYSQRYFAEFSFRQDASSNFAAGNRTGFFPSVGLAWVLSDESFLKPMLDRIGTFKLRGSYGVLGNQSVDPYQYQTAIVNTPNAYAFNNNPVAGGYFPGGRIGNPALTWEKASTLNVALDALLLKRRLDVTFEYFDKTTTDILVQRRDVPALFGAGFGDFNTAEVRNRGWEFRAAYNLPGRIFTHSFAVNLADNLNELRSFTFGATELVERREEFEFVRRVGQPITVYQGYRRAGYFQNLDDIKGAAIFDGQVRNAIQPGDIRFVDRNADGVINDDDKFILGNPFPRYTFGFTYTVQAKGFDLQLFIQGVGKRDAMIRGELVEPFHFGYGGTMYTHQTDYWTPTNPNAQWPRLAEAGSPSNTNNYRTGSDIYLFDAAYARLKNVQFGYSLPAKWVSKARMQRARLYFTGQNLITLTNLNFLDPEITEFDNNLGFNTGANSARAYPMPRFYGAGLDITF